MSKDAITRVGIVGAGSMGVVISLACALHDNEGPVSGHPALLWRARRTGYCDWGTAALCESSFTEDSASQTEQVRNELALPPVNQIGVAVRDVSKAADFYSTLFGVGPFNVYEATL